MSQMVSPSTSRSYGRRGFRARGVFRAPACIVLSRERPRLRSPVAAVRQALVGMLTWPIISAGKLKRPTFMAKAIAKYGRLRAVDQGGQGSDPMDATLVPLFRRQRRPPSASCPRLQSRQLPAHARHARADQRLVADEPQGETDQDWREGREPRAICRFSDGRNRHPKKPLRRHPAAHRRTATAASHVNSMRRSVSRVRQKATGEVRLDCEKFCALNVRFGFGVPRRRPPTGRRQSGGRFGLAGSTKHSQPGP